MAGVGTKKGQAFDKNSYKELISFKYAASWLSLGFLVILAYIPNRIRDLIAVFLSYIAVLIPTKPRRVAYANLRTAFPELSAKQCRAISRRSIAVGFCVTLAYAEPSVLPPFLLKKRWIVHGLEHLHKAREDGRPIIFLAPHTYAIDRCGLYLSYSGIEMCTMVRAQKNKVFDWFLNQQRLRFGGTVYERDAGLRTLIRELKNSHSCFFLPDEDLGDKSALFINFLGVPKATVSTLPKLAKVGNAQVMQLFSTYNIKKASFEIYLSPVFDNYPSDDLESDLKRMNDCIASELVQHKEQYMWILRIFKSLPDQSYPDIYVNTYRTLLKKGQSVDFMARRRPFNPHRSDEIN